MERQKRATNGQGFAGAHLAISTSRRERLVVIIAGRRSALETLVGQKRSLLQFHAYAALRSLFRLAAQFSVSPAPARH
jgi:hypothetical protein